MFDLKIKLIIFFACLCLAFGVIWSIQRYIENTIHSRVQEKIASYQLEIQNKAILKNKLDTQAYVKKAPKIKEKIEQKYKLSQIEKDLDKIFDSHNFLKSKTIQSCENQLKEIENALDIFYSPNHAHAHAQWLHE